MSLIKTNTITKSIQLTDESVKKYKKVTIPDALLQTIYNSMDIPEIRSLYGKLNSMRQIEPDIFPQLYNQARKHYYKLGAQYNTKSKQKIRKKK